jgi:hypothetical protein
LETHFSKHGKEFKGAYNNTDDYLQGARDAMKNLLMANIWQIMMIWKMEKSP